MTNPEFVANQQAIWNGYDPAAFAEGPPDPNFSGQAAAAARQEGQIAAVNAANAAGAGLAANPMSTDPSQRGGGSSIGADRRTSLHSVRRLPLLDPPGSSWNSQRSTAAPNNNNNTATYRIKI